MRIMDLHRRFPNGPVPEIFINDTESTQIYTTGFSAGGGKWTAEFNLVIRDHFGLDVQDVLEFQRRPTQQDSLWVGKVDAVAAERSHNRSPFPLFFRARPDELRSSVGISPASARLLKL